MQPYTLEDLKDWRQGGVHFAVVGHPIAHSLSPAMHQAAIADLAYGNPAFSFWRYHAFDLHPDELAEALPLFHAKNFVGLNLTVPHKVSVLPLLHSRDVLVDRTGAANTLMRCDEGYNGLNTDVAGVAKTLEIAWGLTSLQEHSVIIIGAGGAARAAAVQALELGCASLWIGNRSQDRLEALITELKANYPEGSTQGFDLNQELPQDLPKTGVLIQSTSVGLSGEDQAPIDLSFFDPSLKVFEMIYNPLPAPTMRAALERGMDTASGVLMLVWQGAAALAQWSGCPVNASVMMKAVEAKLKAQAGQSS